MKLLSFLNRLLFPPFCPGCRQLQKPLVESGASGSLCPDCLDLFERSTRTECQTCFLPFYACTCVTPLLQRAGVREHIKLIPYGAGAKYRVPGNFVRYLKRHNCQVHFEFAAKELTPGLLAAKCRAEKRSAESKRILSGTVIAHLPRDGRSIRRFGLDQSEELAKRLAENTGLPFRQLLFRTRRAGKQKALSAMERAKNLKGVFSAKDASGLRVFLVDDIVTTGASMAAAADALYHAGAAEVIAVSLAYTPKKV